MEEITFPVEFVVKGTPVSQRSRLRSNIDAWKQLIVGASAPCLPENHRASEARIGVTIYFLQAEEMDGDLDNILKPILDTFSRYIILDDNQVDRILVQRFRPDEAPEPSSQTLVLQGACVSERPLLYICLSNQTVKEAT